MSKKLCLAVVLVLVATLCFCAPRNTVRVLVPSGEVGGKVVYKTAPDSVNELTKNILAASFKDLGSGFYKHGLQKFAFMCGPSLWAQLKLLVTGNDTLGIPMPTIMPQLDPNEPEKAHTLEARIIRKDDDIYRFWALLNDFLGKPDTFLIRKLTDAEKSLFWTFISWDIEEPVFMVETNGKLFVADLMRDKDTWVLFYLDEYSPIISRWNAAEALDERQKKVHENAKADNLTAAEPEALKALEEAEKLYGKKHKKYGMSLNNLATVYAQENDLVKAETMYVRAANVFIEALGMENSYLAEVYNNLANIYDCQQRYAEAELMLGKALAILTKMFGEDDKNVAIVQAMLASTYKNMKDYDKAVKAHRSALRMLEKNFGVQSTNVAIGYSNFGECLFNMKKYQAADSMYRKAEAILIDALGAGHSLTIGIRANLARNLVYLGRYKQAEPLLMNAIDNDMKKGGRINRSILESVESLGKLYRETGDTAKAAEYEAWAVEIKQKTKPESSCNISPAE